MAKRKNVGFDFIGNLVTGAGKAGGRSIEGASRLAVKSIPGIKTPKVKSL